MPDSWFYQYAGRENGPHSFADMQRLIELGTIDTSTFVRREDGGWVPASSVPGLLFQTDNRNSAATAEESRTLIDRLRSQLPADWSNVGSAWRTIKRIARRMAKLIQPIARFVGLMALRLVQQAWKHATRFRKAYPRTAAAVFAICVLTFGYMVLFRVDDDDATRPGDPASDSPAKQNVETVAANESSQESKSSPNQDQNKGAEVVLTAEQELFAKRMEVDDLRKEVRELRGKAPIDLPRREFVEAIQKQFGDTITVTDDTENLLAIQLGERIGTFSNYNYECSVMFLGPANSIKVIVIYANPRNESSVSAASLLCWQFNLIATPKARLDDMEAIASSMKLTSDNRRTVAEYRQIGNNLGFRFTGKGQERVRIEVFRRTNPFESLDW